MNVKLEVREAIRFMLLPLSGESEDACLDAIVEILQTAQIKEDSYFDFLRLKYDEWLGDQHLNTTLKEIITGILKLSNGEFGDLFADKYFELHSGLLSDPFFSTELSIIILSHLRFIADMALYERMSAAKISRVLNAIDQRLSAVSWKHISQILRGLKMLPQLERIAVEELYNEDFLLEEEYFADATFEDSILQVGNVAKNLHFQGDLSSLLKILAHPDGVHLPYLQILHYQTLISAFYDHVPTTPYEFSPRGNVAEWLFSKWDKLLPTSNPILNNAKAVDVLDENWARSRKSNEYEQATVLVHVLKGLDGMGFAAAQQLTSWLRRWLVRYIKHQTTSIIPLKENLSKNDAKQILRFIPNSPTKTYGILEQRFVDALASVNHSKEKGWRSRGITDSVNSNNLSKRKLGDCDFQHSEKKVIVAYEAHGGLLSKIYYDGHVRTFKRALDRRREELESIADLAEWTITVVFLAYGFENTLPANFEALGLSITTEFVTFNDFAKHAQNRETAVLIALNEYFIAILNERRTPSPVREKIRPLLS